MDWAARERALVYWLNALPFRTCLVVGSVEQLRDGFALAELARELSAALGLPRPAGRAEGPAGRIAGAIEVLREALGLEGLSAELIEPRAAILAAEGDVATLAALAATMARVCDALPNDQAARFRELPLVLPSVEPLAELDAAEVRASPPRARRHLLRSARPAVSSVAQPRRQLQHPPASTPRMPSPARADPPPVAPADGARRTMSVADARGLLDFDAHFRAHRLPLAAPSPYLTLVRGCVPQPAALQPSLGGGAHPLPNGRGTPGCAAVAASYSARAQKRRAAALSRAAEGRAEAGAGRGGADAAAAPAAPRAVSPTAHAPAFTLHEGETVEAAAALFPFGALQRLEAAAAVGQRARGCVPDGVAAPAAGSEAASAARLATAAGTAVHAAARAALRFARAEAAADAAAAAQAAATASSDGGGGRALGFQRGRAPLPSRHAARLPAEAVAALGAALRSRASASRPQDAVLGSERALRAATAVSLGSVSQRELLSWLRSLRLLAPHLPPPAAAGARALGAGGSRAASAPPGGVRARAAQAALVGSAASAWAAALPLELRSAYDALLAFQTGALACQLVGQLTGVRLPVRGADGLPAHLCTRASRARNFGRALGVARARCGSALDPSLHRPDAAARMAAGEAPLLWGLLEGLHAYATATRGAPARRAAHGGAGGCRSAGVAASGQGEAGGAGGPPAYDAPDGWEPEQRAEEGAYSSSGSSSSSGGGGSEGEAATGAPLRRPRGRASRPSLHSWLGLVDLSSGEVSRSGAQSRAEYVTRVWLRRTLGIDVPWGTHARRLHPLDHPLTNGVLALRVALVVRSAARLLPPAQPASATPPAERPSSLAAVRALWREASRLLASAGVQFQLTDKTLSALASGRDEAGWRALRRIARATARSRLLLRPVAGAQAGERAEERVLRWLDRTGLVAAFVAGSERRARGRLPPGASAAADEGDEGGARLATSEGQEEPQPRPHRQRQARQPHLSRAWARARPLAAESVALHLLSGALLSAAVLRATQGSGAAAAGRRRAAAERAERGGGGGAREPGQGGQGGTAPPPAPLLPGTIWPVRTQAAAEHNIALACAALGAQLSPRTQLRSLREAISGGHVGGALHLLALAHLLARRARRRRQAARGAAWRMGAASGGEEEAGEWSAGSDGEEGDAAMAQLAAAMEDAAAMPASLHPALARGGGALDVAWDSLLTTASGGREPSAAAQREDGNGSASSPRAESGPASAPHWAACAAARAGEGPVAWDSLLPQPTPAPPAAAALSPQQRQREGAAWGTRAEGVQGAPQPSAVEGHIEGRVAALSPPMLSRRGAVAAAADAAMVAGREQQGSGRAHAGQPATHFAQQQQQQQQKQRARAVAARLIGNAPPAEGWASAPLDAPTSGQLRPPGAPAWQEGRSVAWDSIDALGGGAPSQRAFLSADPAAPAIGRDERARRALAAKLSEWVRSRAAISLPVEELCQPAIACMSDGLILAQLTGALEGTTISGLEARPRSFASCRHNCERSLLALRLRPNMALDYLYSADALARGDSATVLGLLAHMKRAYGSVPRARQPSASTQLATSAPS